MNKKTRPKEPWKTKEWKEEIRPKLLGDKCEWCETAEQPLVVHHLIKYPDKDTIKFEIVKQILHTIKNDKNLLQKFLKEELLPKMNFNIEERLACPKCNGITHRERTTMKPKYYCQICLHTFDKGKIRIKIEETDWRANRTYLREALTDFIETFANEWNEKFHQVYMKGEHTVTLCKKCHFLYEKKNTKLCQSCKKFYHNTKFHQCREFHLFH